MELLEARILSVTSKPFKDANDDTYAGAVVTVGFVADAPLLKAINADAFGGRNRNGINQVVATKPDTNMEVKLHSLKGSADAENLQYYASSNLYLGAAAVRSWKLKRGDGGTVQGTVDMYLRGPLAKASAEFFHDNPGWFGKVSLAETQSALFDPDPEGSADEEQPERPKRRAKAAKSKGVQEDNVTEMPPATDQEPDAEGASVN